MSKQNGELAAVLTPPKQNEYWTIALLLALYVIQAVPMGISAALPLSLQGRGASYTDLAKFSFASLPFTLKLFWAPLVDTTNLPGHGRRKSWLVPVQLSCAVLMVGAAYLGWPSSWAGEGSSAHIRIVPLTLYFFLLYMLMATQDIAVDGWALEILPLHMKKHASTCNTIGQSLGFYVTNIAFLLFNHSRPHADEPPMPSFIANINISLNSFLNFWGIVIGLITMYVALFVPEDSMAIGRVVSADIDTIDEGSPRLEAPADFRKSLTASYRALGGMLRLTAVRLACAILLLCRLPFGPVDSVGGLKILETGCAKEVLALLAPVAFPIGVGTSYLTGRWMNKRFSPLRAFKYGYVMRLALCMLWLGIYKISSALKGGTADVPQAQLIVYGCILLGICLQTIATEIMFVSQMAFFAQVSDTTMGGTYMTFFNTVANLGNKWPGFVSLALMDHQPVLTNETFVDLTLLGVTVGVLMAFPLGNSLVNRMERIKETDWHLGRAMSSEESIELIKGNAEVAPSDVGRLVSRVSSTTGRV